MPQYVFYCRTNGHNFTAIKKVDERDEEMKCPECGEIAERIVSLPAPPKFNGEGFTEKFYE